MDCCVLHAGPQGCEGAGTGLQRTLKQLQSAAGAASLVVGLAVAMADLVLQVEVSAQQTGPYHAVKESSYLPLHQVHACTFNVRVSLKWLPSPLKLGMWSSTMLPRL